MDVRTELDTWATAQGLDKNKPIGWSVVADFAEYYAGLKPKLCVDCKCILPDDFIHRCPKCWDDIYFPK